MDELESVLVKAENYWQKRCELLEQAIGELMTAKQKDEIIRQAAGHAGGKAHPKPSKEDEMNDMMNRMDDMIAQFTDAEMEEFMRNRKAKTTKSEVPVSKPEVTANYVRIPVHDCKITATIDIDKGQGIKALYCGGEEKQIATYLFPKSDFTMEQAQAWVKEHSKKSEESKSGKVEKSYYVPISKVDEEKRLVYGIVLEPDTVDAQDDIISHEEIEQTAHAFLANSRVVYKEHESRVEDCHVVESYIAPADLGDVKKGSWVMVTHVGNDDLWGQLKKGELTGYSIRGYAHRA